MFKTHEDMELVFNTTEFMTCKFMMQLPYMNDAGTSPFVFDIKPSEAKRLFNTGNFRFFEMSEHLYCAVPNIEAMTLAELSK